MYAMLCTQLDICFAVGLVSHYQSNPGPTHWQAVKRIMRYLHGTTDLVLYYHRETLIEEDTQMPIGVVARMSLGLP